MAISWLRGMARWVRGKSGIPGGNLNPGRPVYWRVWLEQLEKRELLSTFTVVNTSDSGAGSLRQAIIDANAHVNSPPGTPDVIDFNIPGGGVHTISLAAALPAIVDPVDIDGTSQPGYSGTPLIRLDGKTVPGGVDGLTLSSGATGSTIHALAVGGFGTGIVIAADGVFVAGNFIGIDPSDGLTARPNNIGISVGGAGNFIGSPLLGDAGSRNIISGNTVDGISIFGSNDEVEQNYIGTDQTGTVAVPNGQYGIAISDLFGGGTGDNNVIGGIPGFSGIGNVISGNTLGGVAIVQVINPVTGNVLEGNFIGTDATGMNALPNQGPGVIIAAADNTIGGTAAAAGNVISGNSSVGVEIEFLASTGNLVAGNLIGVNKNGTLALPNAADGVILNNAPGNFIGSSAPGAAPNVISGQARSGIELLGANATGNTISNNYVGTDITGIAAIPNGPNHALAYAGIFVESSNNTIGGTVAGAGNLVSGNFGDAGILIQTSAVSGAADANLVAGNLIGTDKTGLAALGNQNNGIDLQSANNTIGGTVAAARNVIAGNGNVGIAFEVNGAVPGSSHSNLIEGNYIGLGSDGSTVLGNARNGVDIFDDSGSNTIGGTSAGAANVISGNGLYGVFVNTPNNVVEGNMIGTDAAGAKGKGSAQAGIFVDSATNTVGGTVAGAGNLISGNPLDGLDVSGTGATKNVVVGNFIGTEVGGTLPLSNGRYGIHITGGATLTAVGDGQLAANHANVISGNSLAQIEIDGAGTNTNIVAGDFIGTDPTGMFAVGSGAAGVIITGGASQNIVGANQLSQTFTPSNRRNIIASPGNYGVVITGSGTTGNIVGGAYIGVAADGVTPLANIVGVDIEFGASGNLIGTDSAGIEDAQDRNVIGGSGGTAILISGPGTNQNKVSGNYVGTNASGSAPLVSTFAGGVTIRNGASNNLVGINVNAANPSSGRNIISGQFSGVSIIDAGTSGNQVVGNYIGTDVTGTVSVGNSVGVQIFGSASNNIVGGTATGTGNLISGNTSDGIDITGTSTTGNVIQGNLIGTNAAGTAALANAGAGIKIDGSANNLIGGVIRHGGVITLGSPANVISGNVGAGIDITGVGATGNLVASNEIGINASGMAALPNAKGVVIEAGASANTIGGANSISLTYTNVVSGNTSYGVVMSGSGTTGNLVQGNLIGTNASGTAVIANGEGVLVGFAVSNTIGGTAAGAGNVISGNVGIGVWISGSGTTGNLVQGNLIGTDMAGAAALPNSTGVQIDQGASSNTIGGTIAAARNLVSGNSGFGVVLAGSGTSGNMVEGNFVGTDVTGTLALANGTGVLIFSSAANNTIGGTTPGAGNLISGNTGDGVDLNGSGTIGNVVEGNLIGTDATGTVALGNANGVGIDDAGNNTIGGTVAGARNVLSGNTSDGVFVFGTVATGNLIEGNLIGTNAAGTAALPNAGYGVQFGGSVSGNTVGGTTAAARNVVSGNATYGIVIGSTNPAGDTVQGNWIGLAADGNTELGNGTAGVLVGSSPNNTIGGTVAGAGNVISGNFRGIFLLPGSGTLIEGNLIGTDPTGTLSRGNVAGIDVSPGSANNTIGGTLAAARNVISGNTGDGVSISGSGTTGNLVEGNYIGTDQSGAVALGNQGSGVVIRNGSANNTIGGTAAGARNVISGNTGDGIFITDPGTGNNWVAGNLIGTDKTGTVKIGANSGGGVVIRNGATNNLIGVDITSANPTQGRNVISGNNRDGVSIFDVGTNNNRVAGNFIGVDATGETAMGNRLSGVAIDQGASNNVVGSLTGNPLERNVIAANMWGLFIRGHFNTIGTNYIGTDANAVTAFGNGTGVLILDSQNTVGGTGAGAGNVISGNTGVGLDIGGAATSANLVAGNLIGTDKTGTSSLGGNNGAGVLIQGGASGNTVGGTTPGAGNLISGNIGDGLQITNSGSTGNLVQGNLIGTNAAGTAALGNAGYGLVIDGGAASNTVGGASHVDVISGKLAGAGNVISANVYGGVASSASTLDVIQGNFIGTDATGKVALGNDPTAAHFDGVDFFSGTSSMIVGGASGLDASDKLTGLGNLISGNGEDGIFVTDISSTGVAVQDMLIQGNFIGTDVTGTVALENHQNGIHLEGGASNNTIGGATAGLGNLISGNGDPALSGFGPIIGAGVLIGHVFGGPGAVTGNVVEGNLIGTDISGTKAIGNLLDGVALQQGATGNTVGGTTAGARNIISGNKQDGIDITGSGTTGNVVEGNYVGTDVTGTKALSNSGTGVALFQVSNNVIGGTAAGAGNVISANPVPYNLEILGGAGNLVQGNFIGTDATGTKALGGGHGIGIDSSNNTIGGTTGAARNIISGNSAFGIDIFLASASGNVVQGNFIGTDATGTVALGNTLGIQIFASPNNTIGGTAAGAGNVISGNLGQAIEVNGTTATGNSILGNLIGTNAAGTAALANAAGILSDGGASFNTIGGTTVGARNIISGNTKDGIDITGNGTSNNLVAGNYIGTNTSGTAGLGNSQYGVYLNTASVNSILDNTISGNGSDGINIKGNGALAGTVSWYKAEGNAIDTVGTNNGTLQNGATFAQGVSGQAFSLDGISAYVNVGNVPSLNFGTSDFSIEAWVKFDSLGSTAVIVDKQVGGPTYQGYILRKLDNDRIEFSQSSDSSASNNLVIDTVAAISDTSFHHIAAVRQGSVSKIWIDGVEQVTFVREGQAGLYNVTSNAPLTIGKASYVDTYYLPGRIDELAVYNRALSSSEVQTIFQLHGAGKGGASIQGNLIGTNTAGTAALANGGNGITVNGAAGNTIGGTAVGAGNVISGNTLDGIDALGSHDVIQGNIIGLNSAGTSAVPNLGVGILLFDDHALVGGSTAAARNVLAGNGTFNMHVIGSPFSTIAGNYFGINAAGSAPIPVNENLFFDSGANNITVGGVTSGAGNVFGGGNVAIGLNDSGGSVSNIAIDGNFIGADPTLTKNLGGGVGISVSSNSPLQGVHNIQIGDTVAGAGNVLTNLSGSAVVLKNVGTDGIDIRGNSIFNNKFGIDLGGSGVPLLNDSQGHVGPNNFQNFPVLTAVKPGATTEFVGSLSSTPSTTFALDFYGNTTADPSGYGQGQFYLGSGTVTTDMNGFGNFDIILSVSTTPGELISVTATDPSTSEFSKDLAANTPPSASIGGAPLTGTVGIPIPLVANVTDPDPGQTLSYAWSVTLNGSSYTPPDHFPTTEQTFILTPGQTGSYQVSLTVADGSGGSGFAAPVAIAVGTVVNPTVRITDAPVTAPANQFLTLHSQVSEPTSPGAVTFTYTWSVLLNGQPVTLPAGTITNAASFTFEPTSGGNYKIHLSVTDSIGGTGSTDALILVSSTNPSAQIFVAPGLTAPEGTPITLSNAVTDAALRGPLSYFWTVTRNNNPYATETDTIGTFTFVPKEEGTYGVSLTVTDTANNTTGTATPVILNITNATPALTITGLPISSPAGTAVTLQGAASDADPKFPGSGSSDSYALSWSVFDMTGQVVPGGTGSSFSLTPAIGGLYQVTLTATDEVSQTTSLSVVLQVTQAVVKVTLTPPVNPQEGTSFTWAANVTPGGTYTYNWTLTLPDGTSQLSNTGNSNLLSFTPILPGHYEASVSVSGSNGAGSDGPPDPNAAIAVVNVAPSVTITVPPPPNGQVHYLEGNIITLSGSAADPGIDLSMPLFNWTVTGPDGFSQTGVQTTMSFTPIEFGTYTATLSVADSNKGVGTATQLITVDHLPPKPLILDPPVSLNSINLVAKVPDPGSDDHFTYQVFLNGSLFQGTTGGATYSFTIPGSNNPIVVKVAVTDDDSGSASTTATIITVQPNVTRTFTAADVGSSDELIVLALGNDNLTVGPTVPSSVTTVLIAVGGHNTLVGGSGPDFQQGDSGSNLLEGGSGPNTLMGTGTDTLMGGSGANQFSLLPNANSTPSTINLVAGSGSNTIDLTNETTGITLNLNTTGAAQTIDPSGNKLQLTGAFQNVIGSPYGNALTASSNSSIQGGGGNDTLMTAGGSNITLSAASGNVLLEAMGGSNLLLQGGKDSDTLMGVNASNINLFGGSGSNDSLSASGGINVTLFGGSGSNDTLSHQSGSNVTLFGGSGSNDSLLSMSGLNVTLFGGSGSNDTLSAISGSNVTLFGGSGSNDTLSHTSSSNVTLFGGSGSNDSLSGIGGINVTMIGGSGSNDTLSHTSGSNVTLFGGSGSNDSLSHTSGSNVTLFGGSGSNDSLSGVGGTNVTLFGGSGSNDTLSHTSGANVTLFGGSGSNDSLSTSGESNVTLFGGSGSNDTLSHTSGSNVTMFGGSGSNDSLTSTGGVNVTLFGGSGSSDTLSHTSGSNVTLFGGSGSNDSLTGVGGTNVTLFGGSGSNDTLSHQSGSNVTLFGGSGGNDSLSSTNDSNISLVGGSGSNDTLSHTSGSNVTLFGGSGSNDSLSGIGGSNVTLFGGSGSNDTLSHASGSNVTLFGGSGSNDSLSSTNESNVTLIGGSGSNDTLSHTSGSNVTLFGGSGSNDSLTGVGGTNVTLFGGSGSNDTLSHTSGTNVTLFGGSGSNDSLSHASGANVTLFGGSGSNDTLSSHTNVNVTLFGGSGSNDSLGSTGDINVTLFGGSGSNDTLTSQTSHNITLFGGSGSKDSLSSTSSTNVTLFGGSGNNDLLNSTGDQSGALIGGSGSNDTLASHTSSNVTLFGGSGSNDSLSSMSGANITLAGGSGNNDTLAATSVNNVNLWAYGGSSDSLTAMQCQNAYLDGGPGNNQTLSSTNGFNVTLYGGSGNNDLLTSTGDVNATLVGGTGSNDTLLSPNSSNITLFGGSGNNDSLSSTGDTNATVVGGSGGLDKLFATNSTKTTLINGGNFGDLLSGSTGTNTSLFGGGGSDTLIAGGNGNIALFGENGDNTYEIDNPLSGTLNVTLDDLATQGVQQSPNDRQSLGINTITFKGVNGITLDLSLASGGQSNQIIQQAVAAGINLSLVGLFQNVVGTPGNDFIKGNSAHNSMMGVSGNDTLVAGNGPATLVAGAGNDLLVGGSGGTTYQFAGSGLGNDTIQQNSTTNNDTVDLSGLTSAASIDLSSNATQVINPNLSLSFTQADIANVIGSPFGNTITGNSRDNQFYLSSGNNTLSGNGGHDTYFFTGNQLGNNSINDSHATNSDTLNFHQFGGPINLDLTKSSQLVNRSSMLTLADAQAITGVVGSDYADSIKGNSLPGGGNTLIGGGGQDSIVGGQGNDLLQAGIPQVVFLDFDTATNPGDHIYTQTERDGIQQELQNIYADLSANTAYGNIGFIFTQSLSQAQSFSRPTGGQYATLFFNKPPEGGLADEVDFRNLDLGGTASIDVNSILGQPGQPAATSQNFIHESAGIAAHELGHLMGMRHSDAYGPPGTGAYEVFVNGVQVSGVDPSKFVPTLVEPTGVTPVSGTYTPDGGQTNFNALIFAQETPLHIMGSPAAIGTSRFDTLGNIYLGEREAIRLAFDDSGTVINAESGPHQSFASAQALGSLPGLTVPNTLQPGALNYGKTLSVTALDVVGSLNIDPNTGKSADDYYSFVGHKGDLMNFQVMSKVLARYSHQFDTVLKIYDSAGNLIAFNDDEFESQDSIITDLKLPADGLYYAVVDSFTPDGVNDFQTGSYELYMYSFATLGASTPPSSSGSTLVAGSGNDILIGSTGNDVFTFLPGSTGNATVVGGNGAGPDLGTDVILETGSPGEHVNVVLPNTIQIIGADADPPHLPASASQTVTEGGLLHFTTTATDADLNDRIAYSLGAITNVLGATIDPTSGDVNWAAADEGSYTIQVIATDLAGKTAAENVTVTVIDVAPTVNPITSQSVIEGTSVALHGSFSNPVPGDSYATTWQVTSSNGQNVPNGTGQDFNFTPLDDGTYTVHFTVTDVDDGSSTTVTTTVTATDATPVVSPIAPLTANEGDLVTLAGMFSDPGALDGFAFNWHVTSTNGQVIADGTNQNFTFTPNDNGIYTIIFTVHDADGGPSGSTTATVTVNNLPPTATFTTNGPIAEGGTATISFTNTFDPSPIDAASLHYSFALQSSSLATSYGAAGSSATAPFVALEEGAYLVYGRIFDKDGGFNDYTTTVTVTDPALVAFAAGSGLNAVEGTAFSNQTLATFTDPGGAESLSDYTATITWGDGQTSAGAISWNGNLFTVTGGHKYSEEGNFAVSLQIKHDQAPVVTVTTSATVADPSMISTGVSSLSAVEGSTTSSLVLATFSDPGGAEVLTDYSATIAWGDGKISAGVITVNNGVFTVSGSHQYAEQGPYSIQVTIGHDSAPAVIVTDAMTVSEASLSGAIQSIAVAEGANTGLVPVATFVDLGGSEPAADYSATIKWGDSSANAGTILPSGDGKTFRVMGSHTYVEEGTYSITVIINHETALALNVTSTTSTVNVSDPAVVGTPLGLNLAQGVSVTNQPLVTFVDPGGPEVLPDYGATINWGDGTPTSTGSITVSSGVFTVAGSHTYTSFGSLTLTVALTHDNSPATTVSQTIAIAPSIIVLNPTLSGALTVSGSSFIKTIGDVVVDSSSSSALTISGTSQITGAKILVVGGVSVSGSAILTPAPTTHAASVPDPFAGLATPSATGLVNQGSASFSTGTHTLNPGIYTQISATNSASIILNPGTYVIKGGGLTVSGAASLSGSGVFIYNAGSNFPNPGGNFGGITISNSGTVSLSAATTGTYANILMFQSRDNNRALSFSGAAVAGISGEIYAKAALLSLSNSAALKLPVVVDRLTVSGAGTSGLSADGSAASSDASVGELIAGDLFVYVNDPAGYFTPNDLTRIQDTIANLNVVLAPYSVTITEVDATNSASANVVIDNGPTTPLGGLADGVLGTFTPGTGEITLVQGWNWYAGADPTAIGPDQYDFETLVTHELGHALGLGHSPDSGSVMFPSLATGVTRRFLSVQDLNIGDPETIPGALIAANFERNGEPKVENRELVFVGNIPNGAISSLLHPSSLSIDDLKIATQEPVETELVSRPTTSASFVLRSPAVQPGTAILFSNALSNDAMRSATFHPIFAQGWFPLFFDPQNSDGPREASAALGWRASQVSKFLNSREVWTDRLADAAIKPLLQAYSTRPHSAGDSGAWPISETSGRAASQPSLWDADDCFRGNFLGEDPILVTLAVLTGTAAIELRPRDGRKKMSGDLSPVASPD